MRRLQPQEGLGHLGVAPRRRVYRGTHPLEPAAPLLRARGIRADVCHRSHSATDEDAHDLTPRVAGGSCDERDLHGGRKESWWGGAPTAWRASPRSTRRQCAALGNPAVIAFCTRSTSRPLSLSSTATMLLDVMNVGCAGHGDGAEGRATVVVSICATADVRSFAERKM